MLSSDMMMNMLERCVLVVRGVLSVPATDYNLILPFSMREEAWSARPCRPRCLRKIRQIRSQCWLMVGVAEFVHHPVGPLPQRWVGALLGLLKVIQLGRLVPVPFGRVVLPSVGVLG